MSLKILAQRGPEEEYDGKEVVVFLNVNFVEQNYYFQHYRYMSAKGIMYIISFDSC
jgi:hypothetical protein